MGEQPGIFEYKGRHGRFLATSFSILLIGLISSYFITLLTMIALRYTFLPESPEPATKWQFIFPLLFLLLFGWTLFFNIKSWLWLLILDDAKLALKAGWGKQYTVHQNEISKVQLYLRKIIVQTETQTIALHLAELPWKEQIIFKSIFFDWVPISALPTAWQAVRHASMNTLETAPCAVKWKTAVNQCFQVNETGLRYQKGRQEKVFNWSKIEAVSSEFDHHRFSFWIDSRRLQINYRGLSQEQLNSFFHALYQYLLKYKIPFEVKTFT